MVTRIVAMQNLEKYLGQELEPYANAFGITTFIDGKQNKGWKGNTLEILAGLTNNNRKGPNGLGFEVKSVAFYFKKDGTLKPKETMAITAINRQELIDTPFFKSHCWDKIKSLIFCACLWHGKGNVKSEFIAVKSFDFIQSDTLIKEIEEDYEFIRKKLIEKGFASLTGKDGKWIQARTKGAGHGSTSRAFYARKGLIEAIFND
jgi:DNA mismatch repair protein MutH